MKTLSNSSTSSSTDYKIIDDSWFDWFLTAIDPNTPPETLDRMASDKYFGVRSYVAENPNTLPETLDRLAEDDLWIRCEVARNPNTPQYLKDYLKIKNYFYCYEYF